MSILIVLSHPKPGSFNHAIAEALRDTLQAAGKSVVLRDLQAEGFDPVYSADEMLRDAVLPPQVQASIDEMMKAEGIIFVHPNYWSTPPAMLKGWLDRVLRPGVCYRFQTGPDGKGYVQSLIVATAGMVVTTANTPDDVDRHVYGDPLQNFWEKCVFGFFGIRRFQRLSFSPVIVSSPEQRSAWLDDARRTALALFV
ncbi:MAG: NAD(P)H dehydrogenase [Candidatus Dactylopiibacterium carminicum]|uniref:Flavodoxin family protein n=1 Tax=Candidatus Dactylopiibacterium carminicum TaxID=857335 RepID=A0A272EMX8_9RHOO|nr:NAD(P)H-dependent oxidoreductase [Candidatus Dactylopiibacterium carminicum]KAF7597878.1 flavodoxin family protein [Candidatus Dactylopiibacterium carminicum]PAS91463.1 MAG: NAD(P)H dehydrogenase [Candidatus Dactylopiibacterium carminicum]PAS92876.1 MAG: NAD(P)H dehydrogenase [Candidatus Dactylopiibacterium carminicum]PAS95825.1 MAG: NAD(P)H dehydrogenase [Candidatus Dactylopiibacterium carminicum]